jgi:hypothetical protein
LPKLEIVFVALVPTGRKFGLIIQKLKKNSKGEDKSLAETWIRILMFHMLLGLPDPDPLVRGTDSEPEPSISKQK